MFQSQTPPSAVVPSYISMLLDRPIASGPPVLCEDGMMVRRAPLPATDRGVWGAVAVLVVAIGWLMG